VKQDDFFIPQPFVPKQEQPDFRRSFWAETPDLRPNRGPDRMATTKVCHYDSAGRHEQPRAPWCTHFEHEDETGFRINPSWTVQWDKVGPDGVEG
jgi:hypothetical protein